MFLLKILCSLWPAGKCVTTRWRKLRAMFVLTFLLKGSSYRLLEWGGSDVTTGSVGFSGSFGASDPYDTSGCDVTSAPFSQNIEWWYIRWRGERGWDLAKGLGLGERESTVRQGSGGSAILVQCGGREGAPSTPSERPLCEDALPRRQSLHPQTTLLLDHYTHKGETFS